jgi:hypothetical protein
VPPVPEGFNSESNSWKAEGFSVAEERWGGEQVVASSALMTKTGYRTPMSAKSSFHLKQLLHVVAVAIVSSTAAVMLMGQKAVVNKETYTLLNINAGEPAAQVQAEINQLADQGWRVRAGVGNWLVLAAER